MMGLLLTAIPVWLHLTRRHQPPERTFPAIQYLAQAAREHQKKLQVNRLLLLLVRVALITTLVMAAAGMRLRGRSLGQHPPVALVLVLDNSASSAAVIDGTPVIDRLRETAIRILKQTTAQDRLWLLGADGAAVPGSADRLLESLRVMQPLPLHLDLGEVVGRGRKILQQSGLEGEVVLLTDLQQSALSAAEGEGDLLVLHPDDIVPVNHSLQRVEALDLPWVSGGNLEIETTASDSAPVLVTLLRDDGGVTELITTPAVPTRVGITLTRPGWHHLRLSLVPDEFRLDDTVEVAIRIAPPLQVEWDQADHYLDAALQVLRLDGRITRGPGGLRIGALQPGTSLLFPPVDPAMVGALNRALAAREVPWRFGTRSEVASMSDSSRILSERVGIQRRWTLEAQGSGADTLLTTAGEPWLVQGGGVILFGSRLEPEWSDLPLRAGFLPLLDRILRLSTGSLPVPPLVVAGEPLTLPSTVTAVRRDTVITPIMAGQPWIPLSLGVHYLLSGADTVGVISSTLDHRESRLTRAPVEQVASLWPGARIHPLEQGETRPFADRGGDLRRWLLWMALGWILIELILTRWSFIRTQ